jgi:hypothetical protein
MSVVLVVVSVIAALIGVVSLSNATMGVGFVAGACLLAILARIAQAGEHHRELLSRTASQPEVPAPAAPISNALPPFAWSKGQKIGFAILAVVALAGIIFRAIWVSV